MSENVLNDARGTVGKIGEDAGVKYIKDNGYEVICRNYRCGFGEIDIIARQKETFVFIEVKTFTGTDLGSPKEAVTKRKKKKIILVAKHYIAKNRIKNHRFRFDVIAVVLDTQRNIRKIEHIINAFRTDHPDYL